MATFPVLLSPSSSRLSHPLRAAWIPALLGMLFVAFTSTNFMGGTHSQAILTRIWEAVLGRWHMDAIGPANLWLRKIGHFIGHGLLSLVFCRTWYLSLRHTSLRREWWRPASGLLAACTTFTVASLDEWHQCYVPGRVGSFRDVVIDVSGALVANMIFLYVVTRRRLLPVVPVSSRTLPLAA